MRGSLLWEGRGIGEPGWSLLVEETNLHLISGVPNTCHWRLIPWAQEVKVAKVPWTPAREERRKDDDQHTIPKGQKWAGGETDQLDLTGEGFTLWCQA